MVPGQRRIKVFAALCLMVLSWRSALAEDGSCDDPVRRSAACGTFSILFENDLFTGTDRYYTNGIKLSWMSRDLRQFSQWEHTPASMRGFFEAFDRFQPGREKNIGAFVGQKLYTPNDIQQRAVIVNDRPYAGWLFGGMSLNSKNSVALDTIELQLGIVGPASLGEETQNFVHEVRGFPTAKGWDNQLDNELAFSLYYERKQRLWNYFDPNSLLGADFIAHAGAAGGTVHTYANGGGELRLGYNIPADFGTSLIRPGGDVSAPVLSADAPHHDPHRFGFHIFGAVTGRAVLRDIFLDGNTFSDSHNVDKKNFVGDFIWGAGVTWRGFKLTYSQIFRTKEFEEQDTASQYGSINLSVIF
ncbi:MAG: lipid A deacylase LpxR family protein [Gammaproteobacteria bacterium]